MTQKIAETILFFIKNCFSQKKFGIKSVLSTVIAKW